MFDRIQLVAWAVAIVLMFAAGGFASADDAYPDWFDTEDPNPATRRHRKYRLTADLSPRNLGLVGRPDGP